ncbi:MAG: rhomboid family intramembrane serine protease [Candidatus Hodarchaeales archaeon]
MKNTLGEVKEFIHGTNEVPVATIIITAIILIIYAIIFIMDPFKSLFALPLNNLKPWLLNGDIILITGDWYRLLSSVFIHFHLAHLGSNLLFLLIYGIRYEELADSRMLLLIFVASGVAGNILTVLIMPGIYSGGSSGAVFGVFGALLVVLREKYPGRVRAIIFTAFLFFSLTITIDTNVAAHLGGLLAGAFLQLLLQYKTS